MNKQIVVLLALLTLFVLTRNTAFAHPASGIVVDEAGQVFFIYSGYGVGKIDPQGKLTYIRQSRGGHWMCLDSIGSFSRTQPRHFERITPPGVKPAVIFADGGSPIAVLPDGNLYYASGGGQMKPGGLHVTRNQPDGKLSLVSPRLNETTEKLGITGLAAGPDGSLYVACQSAVFKMNTNGNFTTIIDSISLADCDVDYPDGNTNMPLPALRGLAVDEHGYVFAASPGCHRVVKITPAGKVQTILSSERPWSPAGVALHHDDVYVLEYSNATRGRDSGWLPRVRKLGRDGKVTLLVTETERHAPATK